MRDSVERNCQQLKISRLWNAYKDHRPLAAFMLMNNSRLASLHSQLGSASPPWTLARIATIQKNYWFIHSLAIVGTHNGRRYDNREDQKLETMTITRRRTGCAVGLLQLEKNYVPRRAIRNPLSSKSGASTACKGRCEMQWLASPVTKQSSSRFLNAQSEVRRASCILQTFCTMFCSRPNAQLQT